MLGPGPLGRLGALFCMASNRSIGLLNVSGSSPKGYHRLSGGDRGEGGKSREMGPPGPPRAPQAPRGSPPFMAWLCHVILPGMAKPEAWKRGMATLNP